MNEYVGHAVLLGFLLIILTKAIQTDSWVNT